MTASPPIYASDFVPAPLGHMPGETEAERVDRLLAESDARFEAAVLAFAPEGERVLSMVAGDFGPQEIANGRQ